MLHGRPNLRKTTIGQLSSKSYKSHCSQVRTGRRSACRRVGSWVREIVCACFRHISISGYLEIGFFIFCVAEATSCDIRRRFRKMFPNNLHEIFSVCRTSTFNFIDEKLRGLVVKVLLLEQSNLHRNIHVLELAEGVPIDS